MSFHVAEHVLSEVTDPNRLRQHPILRPLTDDFMRHIADLRSFYDDHRRIGTNGTTRGGSKGKTMIHVARLPLCVWAEHCQSDPHLLHDKPKIYRLLRTDFKPFRVGGYSLVG